MDTRTIKVIQIIRRQRRGNRLDELPRELLNEIFSYLELDQDRTPLIALRLVCNYIETVVRWRTFRIIRLIACSSIFENLNFLRIAKSDRLRPCVREIRIDTWGGHKSRRKYFFQPPVVFMCVLPYMRFFENLTTCHARFSHTSLPNITRKTRKNYTFWVLDVIINCLASTWTLDRQLKIDDALKIGDSPRTYADGQRKGVDRMPVQAFTASELENPIDKRILRSKAWHDLVDLTTVNDLKLYVVEDFYCNTQRNAIDLHNNLHHAWLTQNLGAKLRSLTLYWRGPGPETFPALTVPKGRPEDIANYFPVLTSLLIGRYTFATEEQAEWITWVGRGPGCNGLEQLCVDGCRVLWEDLAPDAAKTANLLGDLIGPHLYDKTRQPLRWYKIICRWATRLPNLRRFELGNDPLIEIHPQTCLAFMPWMILLTRFYEDDETFPLCWKKTFKDFNISDPPTKLYRYMGQWRMWCESHEWLASRYCTEEQMIEGEHRSIESGVIPFDIGPWMGLLPPRGWEKERYLRLFDEVAIYFLYLLARERRHPNRRQPLVEVLSAPRPAF